MAQIATGQGLIGVDERGGSGATPLVFLHGVGSDKSAWAPQLAAFGTSRRTIALDYPGYGESDPARPADGDAHDRFADAVLAALDALGVERMHLCGLSLGGVVSIAVAHSAPDVIASLTIADSFAKHPEGEAILARSIAASSEMRALAEARVPVLLAPNADPKLADSLIEVMAAIDAAAFRLGSAAVWVADQRDRARAITAPTLILCGSDDRVTPPALSEELARLIAGARLELIPCTGHLPNLEKPAAFNAALNMYLDEIERKKELR